MRKRLVQARRRGLVLAVALLVSVSACSSGDEPPAGTAGTRGALLWDAVFGPTLLDPGHMTASLHGAINNAVYDTLVTFRGDDVSEVVPNLATSWEISPDNKVFTFTLRTDAKFSDNTALTSADVLFSYNRLRNLDSAASFRAAGLTFEAPDPTTFRVTAESPNAGLLVTLTGYNFSVLNSKVAKENGATDAEDAAQADKAEEYLNNHSVGSGPYKLQTNEQTSRVVLVANPNYWGTDKAAFEQIVVRNTPAASQLVNVQAGESDIAMELSPDQIKTIENNPNYTIEAKPSIRWFFLFMNGDPAVSPLTSNKGFQDAVRYGIDYDAIVALAGRGAARATLVPQVVPGAVALSDIPQTDAAKAKASLASAGLTNPKITLTYSSDQAQNGVPQSTVAQAVQSQLKAVGIEVTLKPIPQATMLPQVNDGTVEMGIWTSSNFPDASQFLPFCPSDFPGSLWGKRSRYVDPQANQLCAAAASAGAEARVAAYQEWQKYQTTTGPIVPLLAPAQYFVAKKSIKDAKYSTATYVDLRIIKHASS